MGKSSAAISSNDSEVCKRILVSKLLHDEQETQQTGNI